MIHGLPGNVTVSVDIRFVCRLNEHNITLLSKGSGGLVFLALVGQAVSLLSAAEGRFIFTVRT